MLKLKILSVGKTKEAWLETAIEEYRKRLSATVEILMTWCKDDRHLEETVSQETRVICLDAGGRLLNSEEFSTYILKEFELGGSRLCLVIGGPEGLPTALKQRYPKLSLSPLTLTHQIARLIVVEQIYRAFEISRGSPYHK